MNVSHPTVYTGTAWFHMEDGIFKRNWFEIHCISNLQQTCFVSLAKPVHGNTGNMVKPTSAVVVAWTGNIDIGNMADCTCITLDNICNVGFQKICLGEASTHTDHLRTCVHVTLHLRQPHWCCYIRETHYIHCPRRALLMGCNSPCQFQSPMLWCSHLE